jgi:Ni/Fe-hydrogenase subunit HybB-like protein
MDISTDIMTTTPTLLYPLAWKLLSMTNFIAERHLRNTAKKVMSLVPPTSIIAAWTPSSCTTHISTTVFVKHMYITNPSVTPADAITAAIANLSHLLATNLVAHNNNLQQANLT